ncbi:hypothetical protein DAEQUDRAFT_740547 [Daedalea quercina L-15889]|uniref:Uncharacterized protein n=1 Tax=Daedalea quercina L-15889 TaxID=1314783 RepID=A0A165MGN0_9APHY|nr:hypothetical protein DAEQUDRAFT_740547 [Daedalea quercina L-15889]
MGLGQYPLRLPSYRSAHARRYHPYPTVRRRSNNNADYMVRFNEVNPAQHPHVWVVGCLLQDPIPDFDYEAAEHVFELPPSLQLRPVRRDDDDDDDVTAFELNGSKDAKTAMAEDDGTLVVVADKRRVDHANSKLAVAKPSTKLATLYTLLLFLHYARDRLTKARTNSLGEKLAK